MAEHSVGKIYVELDLDPSRYMRGQQTLLKEAQNGAKILEKNFHNLNIKSDATYDLMRAQAEQSFMRIKKAHNTTVDDMVRAEKAKAEKIRQINEQQYGKQISMMHKFKSNYLAISASIAASLYVIQQATRPFVAAFEKGFNAVEDYAQSVAGLSAMVVTFTERAKGVSLSDQWERALKYSTAMVPILENIAAKTLLSGQETTALANAFARAGVFLNASNVKQVESFTRISNALPLMTKGQEIMRQINSEIRAVMTGANEATSMMLQTLKAIDPEIEKHLKTWRAEGTVLEHIGDLLVGFGPATTLLERQWQAVKSTIETTATQILRGLMKPAYDSIIQATIDLNEWLVKNKDTIINWGTSFRIALISVEAEIVRIAMLLDKVGGTLTTAQMFLYGPGSALGFESSEKRFEKAAEANMMYAERYAENDKRLEELAKKQIALEQELADTTVTAAQQKADASETFTAKIIEDTKALAKAAKEAAKAAEWEAKAQEHLAEALEKIAEKQAKIHWDAITKGMNQFHDATIETMLALQDLELENDADQAKLFKDVMDDLNKSLEDQADLFDYTVFGDSADQNVQNLMKSLNKLLKTYDDIAKAEKEQIKRLEEINKIDNTEDKNIAMEAYYKTEKKLALESTQAQIGAYGQLFGALSQMFDEQSTMQKAMLIAEQAMAVVKGVMVVLNAGAQGDGYTVAARMAAAAAAVAAILSIAGIAFSGGGSGGSVVEPVEDPSTVLGADAGTGSESILNAFDILQEQNDEQLWALYDIYNATKDLTQSIMTFVVGILQGTVGGGGLSGMEYKIPGFSIGSIGSGSITGYERGPSPEPGESADDFNNWIKDYYQWALAGFDELNEVVLESLTRVFRDIGETFVDLAIGLGVDVQDVLDYVFPDIHLDLTGLSESEIEDAVLNYFSSLTDTMAESLFGDIVGPYQQIGEGMYETAVRVLAEKEAILSALSMTGQGFEGTAEEAVHFTQALIELADSFEALTEDASTYFEQYLTEAEQLAWLTDNLASGYAAIGREMPATRQAFKDLISGLDLTKEADRALYIQLLDLAGATDAYYDALEAANQTIVDAQRELLGTTDSGRLSDIEDMFDISIGMEDAAYWVNWFANATTDEIRDMAKGLGISVDDLVDTFMFLNDYFGITGDTVDDFTAKIMDLFNAVNDRVQADVGGTTGTRDSFNAIFDKMLLMWNTEPMTEEILLSLVEQMGNWWTAGKAVADEQFRLDMQSERERLNGLKEEQDALMATAKAFKSLVDQIDNVVQSIKYSDLNLDLPTLKAQTAKGDYNTLLAEAKRTGSVEDYQAFVSFAQTALQQYQNRYKSSDVYQEFYAQVMGDLETAKGYAEAKSYDEAIVNELDRIAGLLEDLNDMTAQNQGYYDTKLLFDGGTQTLKGLYDAYMIAIEAKYNALMEAESSGMGSINSPLYATFKAEAGNPFYAAYLNMIVLLAGIFENTSKIAGAVEGTFISWPTLEGVAGTDFGSLLNTPGKFDIGGVGVSGYGFSDSGVSGAIMGGFPDGVGMTGDALNVAAVEYGIPKEAWSTSGLMVDIKAGSSSSFPSGVGVYNGALKIAAVEYGIPKEAWSTSGLMVDIKAGSSSSFPSGVGVYNGALKIAAVEYGIPKEAWSTTGLMVDIKSSALSFYPATQAVSGTFYPAIQAVSGTVSLSDGFAHLFMSMNNYLMGIYRNTAMAVPSPFSLGDYNLFEQAYLKDYTEYFADGSIVNSPTLGWVGEAGYPEAIIPMKDGMNIPVKWLNGGSTQAGANRDQEVALLKEQNRLLRQIANQDLKIKGMNKYMRATAEDVDVERANRGKSASKERYVS